MLTKQTSIDPSSDGADIWGEALDVFFQSDPELIGYVQRIVGLAAIGRQQYMLEHSWSPTS